MITQKWVGTDLMQIFPPQYKYILQNGDFLLLYKEFSANTKTKNCATQGRLATPPFVSQNFHL